MSDRDANHLLVELQEARHLADSNRKAFLAANRRCVELMDFIALIIPYLPSRDIIEKAQQLSAGSLPGGE